MRPACAWGAIVNNLTPITSCTAPAVFFEELVIPPSTTPVNVVPGCLMPFLIEGEVVVEPNGDVIIEPVTAVCIETLVDVKQTVLDGAGVGTIFFADGIDQLITSGAPSCEFNCIDGFDVNCDGVIGDFCPVELDATTVAGARDCLAALAGPDAAVESVPAAHATIEVVDVATSADETEGLAHTGSETNMLAYFGTGLLGFGALARGYRRRHATSN